ncbi:hypothetical protein EY221_01325 [Shigella sonnei]|nr:hypothetical protein [Salmonella enterica]EAP5510073.1 hypothetical protein [Salmonella enterica]EFX3389474.1 hypothetical protein [Shigella sonnei]KAA9282908.1 hypothetical protein F6I13_17880 [Escherichia coli]RRM31782.1 hypothetical protein DU300_21115 [Escherichia coli]
MPQQGMWHEKTAEKINNMLRGRGVFLCDYTRINKLLAANEPGNLFFISVRRNLVSQRPDNKVPECICGELISGKTSPAPVCVT